MTTCTFIGHDWLYDRGLECRLKRAIRKVIRQEDAVEFLFVRTQGDFFARCLTAVWEAKRQYPEKRIAITLVKPPPCKEAPPVPEAFARSLGEVVPACLIEKTVVAPVEISQRTLPLIAGKKAMFWAIRQTDVIFSYIYFDLRESVNRQYQSAKSGGKTIYDLTEPETRAYIKTAIKELPQQERDIIHMLNRGMSYKQIGMQQRVSSAAIADRAHAVGRKIQSALAGSQNLANSAAQGRVCGIVGLSHAGLMEMEAFETAVYFLLWKCGVKTFLIEPETALTIFGRTLEQLIHKCPKAKDAVVTQYGGAAAPDWEPAKARYAPPFHDAGKIDPHTKREQVQLLRTEKAIIDRSDYLICKLDMRAGSESIRKHLEKRRDVKVLDLGKGT